MSSWYLGTIGFSYKDWEGSFYPTGTPQRGYLAYYSKAFNCVELDTTFHSIPRAQIVQSWMSSTPPGFRFCLKTPRLITHELKLAGALGAMAEFIDSLQPLAEKMGPVLIQLPPRYSQENYNQLAEFLAGLPRPNKYAVEFRHISWYNAKTSELLSRHQVGWVATDFPNLPKQLEGTCDFLYIRWIGINGMYQRHTHERVDKTSQLKWWLDSIRSFEKHVSTIYGFFNNDYAGFAAGTCRRFKQLAGMQDEEDHLPTQERLF